MNDPRRVDVLEAAQDLVDEKLHVLVGERLRLEDVVQVGAHQVGDKIPEVERALLQRVTGSCVESYGRCVLNEVTF